MEKKNFNQTLNEVGVLGPYGETPSSNKIKVLDLDKEKEETNEDGFPGGIGTGLVLPGGYINGAPTGSNENTTEGEFEKFLQEYFDNLKLLKEDDGMGDVGGAPGYSTDGVLDDQLFRSAYLPDWDAFDLNGQNYAQIIGYEMIGHSSADHIAKTGNLKIPVMNPRDENGPAHRVIHPSKGEDYAKEKADKWEMYPFNQRQQVIFKTPDVAVGAGAKSNIVNEEIYDPITQLVGKTITTELFEEWINEYFGEEKNKELDRDITYTASDGTQKKIRARDALRLPKDHPAHIQAAKIKGPDDTPANEPKKKEEPGKAAQKAAEPAAPGQPTKQGQTIQGKIDKQKETPGTNAGGQEQMPEPHQQLKGVELKTGAEDRAEKEKNGETKKHLVNRISEKVKKWSKEEKETFQRLLNKKEGHDERRDWGRAIMDKSKGASHAIMHGLKHEYELFKSAGDSVKTLISGGKLDDKQKKNLKKVGIKIAATALFAAFGGGLAHGVSAFAKHIAMELIPHAVGEAVVTGVSKAAMFAEDVNEATALNIFAAAIAERLQNMDLKPEVIEKIVDSWNNKKVQQQFKIDEEHYVPSTGMFNRRLTPQQKIDKLNPARAIQKAKIWHQKFAHHNPETGEPEEDDTINEMMSNTKKEFIQDFVDYATERLKLNEKPKVTLLSGNGYSNEQSSLGGYNPETKEIYVQTEKRLGADILRTIAHEMVHRKQDEMGLIKDPISAGKDGSPIENQAHAVAGILMREYGRKNKQIYTETIKKVDDKYVVYPKAGGKRLGTHDSLASAKKQLAAIEINKEDINVDVDKGDTILMGKFKNKKVDVKDIGEDPHGMPTINGKQATTFRTIDEMGSKDIHFANMIKLYKDAKFRKRINVYLFGNPNGNKANDVARALRNMDYTDITSMEKDLNIKPNLDEVSAMAGDDSQPDGGYLPKGHVRKLGADDGVNKGDDWYKNGGYTQVDFPVADAIYGDADQNMYTVQYKVKNLKRNDKGMQTNFPLHRDKIEVLTEGGAAGHLAHPFEDENLKFSDMKKMIQRGLVGGLDKEAPVSEKLDGQNIAFSVKNGNIVFGRNKGHVRNSGENALDVQGIAKQFAGRGGIEKAFTGAAEDLHAAVSKLKPEQVKKMFGNGSKFMSLEIILPDTTNVIPYGKSVLVMHGTIQYDREGNEIGRSTEDASEFAKAVQKVGADKQKTFGIEGPKTIAFSDADTKEYAKKSQEYRNQLSQVQKQFGLSDNSKLEDYRRKWWLGEINRQEKELGIKFSPSQKKGLIKRWADGDKSFGVKSFEQPAQQQWFRDFEANKLQAAQKQMIKPIENVFLNVGAQTLKRVTNFLASNNPGAADALRKDTLTAIKAIKDSKDPDKIAKLQTELERLNSIGMDKVVPSEGIVFQYGGKPYKFTGAFAPINQINGTFKFEKPKAESKEDNKKTIAIFSGRFQPFHEGHYSIYKNLVDRFGKDNVYIASSNAQDPVKSPFPFKDKKNIMTTMFGIPSNKVVQVKNPYAPVEILDKQPKDTHYVTAVSQKDAERLEKGGKYFKNYDKVKNKKGYEDEGYFIVAPEMQVNVNGKNISGTQLRATFGSDILSLPEKKKIFQQIYPKFDKNIFAKIVATTKKAEQAKKSNEKGAQKPIEKSKIQTGDKLQSKIKSLDPKTKKRVQKVLQTKIKNPETGKTILVKSALKYDDKKVVKKNAMSLIKQAMGKK